MPLMNEWGPATLLCLTVVVGVLFQNKRIYDTNTRIADFRSHFDKRNDDLRDLMKSEISRLEKRIDSLESPLVKR